MPADLPESRRRGMRRPVCHGGGWCAAGPRPHGAPASAVLVGVLVLDRRRARGRGCCAATRPRRACRSCRRRRAGRRRRAVRPTRSPTTPDREAELVRRAAAGTSHVLYARSPGGATATARARRPLAPAGRARRARRRASTPDLLEGLVFLESAGRAGRAWRAALEGAVGLTQILAETGQQPARDARRRRAQCAAHAADRARARGRAALECGAAAGRAGARSTSASTPPRRSPARRAT